MYKISIFKEVFLLIYFDNAATTRVRDEVLEAMTPFFSQNYGNPSSVYEIARTSKKAVETAREKTAAVLGAQTGEIFFTSGGTESDNWAINSAVLASSDKGKHIITSVIEHHAVLEPCENFKKNGYSVTFLPVDNTGKINPDDLKKAIRDDTVLVSIMFANNEIGTIMPIAEIGEITRQAGVLFHTDAVQAVSHAPIDVKALNIDLLSLSAHKVYGPKGVGALYINRAAKIPPFLRGGAQESKKRAGTENVAGIVGLGEALYLLNNESEEENARLSVLRDYLIENILKIPHTRLNGHRTDRLPGNINISFDFLEGESLLLMLDMKGIAASSGSACTSGSLDPSHVLMALGLDHATAHGSLRLTLGRYNTKEEADALLKELPAIVQKLRDMSPLYMKK